MVETMREHARRHMTTTMTKTMATTMLMTMMVAMTTMSAIMMMMERAAVGNDNVGAAHAMNLLGTTRARAMAF